MKQNKRHGLPEVGSRHQNNKGEWFTVVEVNGCLDIKIEFDDRKYIKQVTSDNLRKGRVALPSLFVGDIVQDKQGIPVEIVLIDTTERVHFKWPDGYIRVCQSCVISLGTLMREDQSRRLNPEIKVGNLYKTKQGCTVEVVEYNTSSDITVKFTEPKVFFTKTTQHNLKNGYVRNRYIPTVAGVGIIGDEVVDVDSKLYKTWSAMLSRVYSESKLKRAETYRNCTVDSRWFLLENFKTWYDKQVIEDDWHLDKDLLKIGSKCYSEDNCVFLPRDINNFLTDRAGYRGEWPIGVTYHERLLKWEASCNIRGERVYLGVYTSPEKAFQSYKVAKESYAKELAEKWKDQIDPRAYQALLSYKVEITD